MSASKPKVKKNPKTSLLCMTPVELEPSFLKISGDFITICLED
jgi:hypothetical protein